MASQYETYLKALLAPLAVYDLSDGTFNESELYSLGRGLDTVSDLLEVVQKEALTVTAEGDGLARREALFARKPAASTTEQRRMAIAALMQIGGDSLTLHAINATISGCGISAKAQETSIPGHIQVTFPKTIGIPDGIDQIEKIILDIIPSHLETEFYFHFLTWAECEQQSLNWSNVETAQHTWESFERAVLLEE